MMTPAEEVYIRYACLQMAMEYAARNADRMTDILAAAQRMVAFVLNTPEEPDKTSSQ